VLDCNTIIWQLFSWYIYYSFIMVSTEVSDVSADLSRSLRVVRTLCIKIYVLLAKWDVTTKVRSISIVILLPIPLEVGWTMETAAPRFTSSKIGFYHSHRISLILFRTFAKCLIVLSIATSLGSQKACCICIQLITAIVLHSHKTLLHPLSDLWLSLFVRFIPYMNCAFASDPDLATSSRVQKL